MSGDNCLVSKDRNWAIIARFSVSLLTWPKACYFFISILDFMGGMHKYNLEVQKIEIRWATSAKRSPKLHS